MSFFSKFPTIEHQNHILRDITRRIRVKEFLQQNVSFLDPYRVKDGETPESIAYDFYGDSEKHWIILILNDVIDPFFDWVKEDDILLAYTENKYGIGNINAIHHWELDGRYVPSTTPLATAVTNIEYETLENEKKRNIKVAKRQYIDSIESEFETKIIL